MDRIDWQLLEEDHTFEDLIDFHTPDFPVLGEEPECVNCEMKGRCDDHSLCPVDLRALDLGCDIAEMYHGRDRA